MYESYSRQALPSTKYRELLGSALCVFNSNNAFIIENILNHDVGNYSWHGLIDETSGNLSTPIKETITRVSDTEIAKKFSELIRVRNRIIHSFQVTHQGEQILATKDRSGNQYIITEEYLLSFIKDNEELAVLLDSFRGN